MTSYGGSAVACNADFCVRDEKEDKTFYINITWTANRKFLMVNGNYYRNTKEPEYYESARGVFLGMNKEDMLALLGTDDTEWVCAFPDGEDREVWLHLDPDYPFDVEGPDGFVPGAEALDGLCMAD